MSIYSIHTRSNRFNRKKASAFGLFVIQEVSSAKSLIKASLDYQVLRAQNLSFSTHHTHRYQLLPLTFLHDNAVGEQRLPREITPHLLDILRIHGSDTGFAQWRKTSHLEKEQNGMDCTQPSENNNNDSKNKLSVMLSTRRALGRDKVRRVEMSTTYALIRLHIFFQTILQFNVYSLSFFLDREPQLITDVTHPDNGYSPIILAMLTQCKRKRRVLLHLLIEKLTQVLVANAGQAGENAICDRVLRSHDTMLGRDCIAWACFLGLLAEARALINTLVVSVNYCKPDLLGETYLHLAVRSRSLPLVKWLASRMYELELPCTSSVNYLECTTVDVAHQVRATEIAQYLQQTDRRLYDYLQL